MSWMDMNQSPVGLALPTWRWHPEGSVGQNGGGGGEKGTDGKHLSFCLKKKKTKTWTKVEAGAPDLLSPISKLS